MTKYIDKSKYKGRKVTERIKCVACNISLLKGAGIILHPLVNGKEKDYHYHYDCWFR